jgi:hypothetical protein
MSNSQDKVISESPKEALSEEVRDLLQRWEMLDLEKRLEFKKLLREKVVIN